MTVNGIPEPDLFGGALRPQQTTSPPATAAKDSPAASRAFGKAAGGSPREAAAALADIHDGLLGVLDNTDRIVRFVDYDQVRQSHTDDVIAALARSGYITENDNARVSCRHGAVRRPVVPLKLTRSGRALLDRWSALQGVETRGNQWRHEH